MLNMWADVFRDSWSNKFQTSRDPFTGFGGFFGERPHPFRENPVYFPYDKPRRVSNRKKARRVEDRSSATSINIPVCCQARENPSTKKSDTKLKKDVESNRPDLSQPKLSQAEVEIPAKIHASKEEDSSDDSCEESFYDASEDVVEATDHEQRPVQSDVETTEHSEAGDEVSSSQVNQNTPDTETAKEPSSAQVAEEQKLNAIKSQLTRAKELIPRVEAFEGSRQDKEFLYLEEHLTRCILGLDLIDADGLENVKLARKAAVKEILFVINDLETSVSTESS